MLESSSGDSALTPAVCSDRHMVALGAGYLDHLVKTPGKKPPRRKRVALRLLLLSRGSSRIGTFLLPLHMCDCLVASSLYEPSKGLTSQLCKSLDLSSWTRRGLMDARGCVCVRACVRVRARARAH